MILCGLVVMIKTVGNKKYYKTKNSNLGANFRLLFSLTINGIFAILLIEYGVVHNIRER